MAENFGVQGRGAFYEEVGAIRDVVQNHLLQVIALLAMDAPVGHEPQAMQAEKLRLFRAMRPLDPKEVVRGQFRGYRDEKGVAKDSQVETFAALRLHIDTWRWADVPFYIRAGKCLPITATEVTVTLKRPPLAIFDPSDTMPRNYFRLRLSPEVVIGEGALVKRNGEEMRGEPVELIARHHSAEREISLRTPAGRCHARRYLAVHPGRLRRGGMARGRSGVARPARRCSNTNRAPGVPRPRRGSSIGGETWHDPEPRRSAPC